MIGAFGIEGGAGLALDAWQRAQKCSISKSKARMISWLFNDRLDSTYYTLAFIQAQHGGREMIPKLLNIPSSQTFPSEKLLSVPSP